MAVSVKMGVDINQFKTGMAQAQQAIKTTNAQLKAAAAEYKATGDKEKYMAEQSKLLKTQMAEQEKAVKNAQSAMEAMRSAGVDETSAAYQKLAQQLASAQTAMYQTQAALNSLGQEEQQAAGGANELADNLKSINKKVSFDAVIGGIDKITSALSNAVKKAVSLGQSIFNSLMDSARWADDVQTSAQIYGVTVDQYLRMEALVATGMDTSVDAILEAQQRLRRGIGKESNDTMKYLKQFGLVVTEYGGKTSEGFDRMVTDDQDEIFFRAGQAIMEMGDAFEQEAAAQAIFGRSWRELIPLFKDYHDVESFNQALAGMNVNTEDQVKDLAELNDAMSALEHDFQVLKTDILASLAPTLKDVAQALSEVVKSVTEYLRTDEGQAQLKRFADAIAGIVEDITNIDPEAVVNTFATVVEGIVSAFEWITKHWSEVKDALIAIGVGFAAIKLASVGLTVAKVVTGFKGLLGGGASAAAGASGAGAGAGAGAAGAGTGGATAAGAGAGAGANATAQATSPATAAGSGFLSATAPTAAYGSGASASLFGTNVGLGAMAGEAGMGGAIGGAGSLTAAGAFGGTALIAAGVYFGGKYIASLNDAARKAREVSTDMDRFTDDFTKFENDYSFGGVNKRSGAEGYINSFYGKTGDEVIASGYRDMQNLAILMGKDLLQMFDYVNTSGEQRNKLIDMLSMSGPDAAVAAMMLHYAGVELEGSDRSKQQEGWAHWQQGVTGTEANVTLSDFFDKSMEYTDGRFRIKGLEASNEIMPVINGMPLANMSGYVMTSEQNKPRFRNGILWYNRPDVENQWGVNGTWNPDEHIKQTEATDAQNKAADSMDAAAAIMEGLPEQVAAAINGSKFSINLFVGMMSGIMGHANGLWNVPWDGYPAMLHRGERVLTARENQQYTYNNYFGNVNLNNGLEIEALTESIDRRNRRQRQGYGS